MQGNIIKLLAKDSMIYGLSSILARVLNFLLLPVYTRILSQGDFGIYNEMFTFIVLLQVVLVFGLETGVFHFASKPEYDAQKVFSTASTFLCLVSTGFFILMFAVSKNISEIMGYSSLAVIYTGGILAADAFTAIFFARLRYERKTKKFALFRCIKIFSEIAFNLLFLFILPKYFIANPDSVLLNFFTPKVSYVYIMAAIFCSALVSILLFLPEIIRIKYRISASYFKPLFLYSFPLMLAGLQGISNDFVERLLFRHFAPETALAWNEQLGIFTANARLAVIMALCVQVFRYAAEPYFFSESSKTDIKPVYAKVMKYFTIFSVIIFVAVNYYADILQYLLGKNFRSGIEILPIMLFANLLLGISQNVAMWYKLAAQTKIAILVTATGLAATILINILFMPHLGYWAAAWGHVVSYSIMIIVSWNLSKRYYRIPYQWKTITAYIAAGLIMLAISKLIETSSTVINMAINTVLISGFIFFVWKKEKNEILNENQAQ